MLKNYRPHSIKRRVQKLCEEPLSLKLTLAFLLSVCVLIPKSGYSALGDNEANQLIEVEFEPDLDLAYSERRGPRSTLFGLRYENFKPEDYFSQVDASSYASNYGDKSISLLGATFTWKRNFSSFSVGVEPSISYGRVDGKDALSSDRSLILVRYGLGLSVMLDALKKEPWLVPYAEIQPLLFNWEEDADTENKSGTSELTFAYRAGLLIQLNKLDERAARVALVNYGLDNTFLDLFIHQHMTSESSNDVDLQSDLSYGAGFKLEF